MKKMLKKYTVRSLKKKLDVAFSKYIRMRDCKEGYGQCITCRSILPFNELDAGHFVGRRYNHTRYDEMNVNTQCRRCNRFEGGEKYEYGKRLNEKYGEGTAEELERKSCLIKKFTVEELKGFLEYYTNLIKEMK